LGASNDFPFFITQILNSLQQCEKAAAGVEGYSSFQSTRVVEAIYERYVLIVIDKFPIDHYLRHFRDLLTIPDWPLSLSFSIFIDKFPIDHFRDLLTIPDSPLSLSLSEAV